MATRQRTLPGWDIWQKERSKNERAFIIKAKIRHKRAIFAENPQKSALKNQKWMQERGTASAVPLFICFKMDYICFKKRESFGSLFFCEKSDKVKEPSIPGWLFQRKDFVLWNYMKQKDNT